MKLWRAFQNVLAVAFGGGAALIVMPLLMPPQPSAPPIVLIARPVAAAAPTASAAPGTLDLIVDDGLYTDQRDELARETNEALAYVIERFGSGLSGGTHVVYTREDNCFLHGIAHTDERTVQVFTCNAIAIERAVVIMAHEFVHQLAQDRYGPAHLSADLILAEGVATGGAADFRSYVRGQRASGVFYPLATDYTGKGIGAQNALYYQWASFVEFLITTYGRATFDRVYVAGQGAPGSADYQGVYGKGLDVLEMEWEEWIR
jgi:hypothetical protein